MTSKEIKSLKIVQLQESAAYWTKKVLEGTCSGLAIVGPGGLGKTYAVEKYLQKKKIDYSEKGKNSHTTPLALYQTLYEFREKSLLILDDIEHIYKQEVSVGILRSALWGSKLPSGRMRRFVTYSTSREIKVPDRFEYNGGIIIIGNKIPRKDDPIVDALLTRIPLVEFVIEPEDIYEFMRRVMVKREGYAIYDGLRDRQVKIPRKDCEKVIEERHITDLRKLEFALIAWKDFKNKPERFNRELDNIAYTSSEKALESPKSRAYEIFLEMIKDSSLSENDKATLFEERTRGLRPGRTGGYNRATFFRWKAKYFDTAL